MPAVRDGLCPVLPDWWNENECPYLLFIPTQFFLCHYDGLYLCGDSFVIRRIVTLAIFELSISAGSQFLLYGDEGAAMNYFVGSLRFQHIDGSLLYRLPTPI